MTIILRILRLRKAARKGSTAKFNVPSIVAGDAASVIL
jgi:hypothetical protein